MDTDVALAVLLGIAALIHLPPVIGVLGVAGMEKAYGTRIEGSELAILMRHRAVLLGLLGALLVAAIVDHDLRAAAIVGCLVSDVAFALLCLAHRDHDPAIERILKPDLVSIVVLLVAGGIVLGG